MKISYFYNIRFFTPNEVPLSTAVWDPKWYYNFKQQGHVWIDKRGVINGLRIYPLVPKDDSCRGPETCVSGDPNTCAFLQAYYKQLQAINMLQFLDLLWTNLSKLPIQGKLEPVFIVYEKYDNPCSERVALKRWFKDYDIDLDEWRKL